MPSLEDTFRAAISAKNRGAATVRLRIGTRAPDDADEVRIWGIVRARIVEREEVERNVGGSVPVTDCSFVVECAVASIFAARRRKAAGVAGPGEGSGFIVEFGGGLPRRGDVRRATPISTLR